MRVEYWKPIPGYEGLYQISNLGRVKSLHKRNKDNIMSVHLREGYPSVILSKNGKWKHERIHRLVALAFVPNPGNKPFVSFLDRNRKNHSIDNLIWITQSESIRLSKSIKAWEEVYEKINDPDTSKWDLLRTLNENFKISRITA